MILNIYKKIKSTRMKSVLQYLLSCWKMFLELQDYIEWAIWKKYCQCAGNKDQNELG